jgi:ubiquitin-like protein Pup
MKQVRYSEQQEKEARDVAREPLPAERAEKHEETLAKTDELLDEIDEALAAVEETVARDFRQKGGQ